MFAFASFIGFESAALYGEEAEDPKHSVPRATITAVLLIGVFYCLTSWVIVGAGGVAQAAALPADDVGDLVFNQAEAYLGETFLSIMAVFFVTSVLASLLAIHNAASRYMFALGREGLLPRKLGQFHPRRYAPSLRLRHAVGRSTPSSCWPSPPSASAPTSTSAPAWSA